MSTPLGFYKLGIADVIVSEPELIKVLRRHGDRTLTAEIETRLCQIGPNEVSLCLTNPEHLSAAYRACPLSRWLAILHGDSLGVFHFPLNAAFHTVCLHWSTSLFPWRIEHSYWNVNNLLELHFLADCVT